MNTPENKNHCECGKCTDCLEWAAKEHNSACTETAAILKYQALTSRHVSNVYTEANKEATQTGRVKIRTNTGHFPSFSKH